MFELLKLLAGWRILLYVLTLLGTGCVIPNLEAPKTKLGVDPLTHTFYFYDSKNNSVSFDELTYHDANGRDGSLKNFKLINDAAAVREAEARQQLAYVEEMKAGTEALKEITGLVRELAPFIGPGLQARLTPQPTITGEVAKGIGDVIRAKGGATSQPVTP